MKPDQPTESDESLRTALRQWQVTQTLPPRFGEQVWQRIAREEAQTPASLWAQLMRRLGSAFLRPSLAIGYATVLLLTGLLAGYVHARAENARASQELGARYVQMMTPYQTPRR